MASFSIPKTMKGVVIEQTGGPEVLKHKTDLPVPQPKAGEVLVKNDFIGVNFIDTYFRSGLYSSPYFPYILGHEASGTIVATGPSNSEHINLSIGDRVAYLGIGANAEYTATPILHAVKIPQSISSQEAAAVMLQGATALTLIREAHRVEKGDWVLVHAAAGGVGSWLCQLLRAVGARTIGTASTEDKMELAKRNGAEVLINYINDDVVAKVNEVTDGKGVVAVFDGVGKATFDTSLDCLARKGTMVSFGNASGAVPPIPILRLSAKNTKLVRPALQNYLATREEVEHTINELFQFMEEGKIDVRIHKIYDLKDLAQAHKDLEGRVTTGKLILKA